MVFITSHRGKMKAIPNQNWSIGFMTDILFNIVLSVCNVPIKVLLLVLGVYLDCKTMDVAME